MQSWVARAMVLALLVPGGCAATRPENAPAASRTSAVAACPAPDATTSTPASALGLAETVLLTGAIAAAVVLGTHGGPIAPPVELHGAPSCAAAAHATVACAVDPSPCDVAVPPLG